jgi:O-antigen/teichoic acid export membrane protein
MMLAIVPLLLALAGQNLLLAHQRITAYNLIDLFPRILAFVAAAAIFLWMDRSEWVVAIIWVTVWYAVLTGGLNLLYAWRADAFPFALDFSVLREMLGYGWKSYYANLMAFLIGQIDVVFLNAFISETDAGIYGRVVYLGNLVYFIPATLGTILFPKLMQGGASECTGEDERSRFTMLVARMVTLMLLLMWVLFILVGRWLLLIFGPDFVAGYGPMVIMLGGMGMLGIETILAAELARRGLPMFVVVYSTVCFAVKLIANVVLVQRYGMYGAAWSALVTYAAFLALVLGYCVKCYGFSVSRTLFIQRGDISLVVQRLRAAVGKGQQE